MPQSQRPPRGAPARKMANRKTLESRDVSRRDAISSRHCPSFCGTIELRTQSAVLLTTLHNLLVASVHSPVHMRHIAARAEAVRWAGCAGDFLPGSRVNMKSNQGVVLHPLVYSGEHQAGCPLSLRMS